ncbi:MAG: carboxymuconolactone decarboxylase family protein [Planctomycetes bacterium]|nr:carboxymuconolactone decarboxylase family protein [Planctomycetota bacterium]
MRLTTIPTTTTNPAVTPLYAAVKSALGMVPNLMQVVGNSPAALEGYLGLNAALGKGKLPAAVRERIALVVAQDNRCDYCLAAHTLLGKGAGLAPDEIQRARLGTASDAYAAAAVTLARAVNAQRGHVSDAEVAAARSAGLDDGAIVEVVLNVALNVLTNSVNNLAQTTIDFPAAPALAARQA